MPHYIFIQNIRNISGIFDKLDLGNLPADSTHMNSTWKRLYGHIYSDCIQLPFI